MRRFSNPRFSWSEGFLAVKNGVEGGFDTPTGLSVRATATHRQVRHLTDTEVDELIAGYRAGVPIRALTEQFNVGRTTLFMHLRRRGIPRRSAKLTDEVLADAAQRYNDGQSLAEIAAAAGVGSETLRRALHSAGMTLRSRGRQAADTTPNAKVRDRDDPAPVDSR